MALSKHQQRVLVEALWMGAKELIPIPGVKASWAVLEHMHKNWHQEQIPLNVAAIAQMSQQDILTTIRDVEGGVSLSEQARELQAEMVALPRKFQVARVMATMVDLRNVVLLRPPQFEKGYETRDGQYQLQELLGVGSFGEVWRARHLDQDKDYAVKFCTDQLAADILKREQQVLRATRKLETIHVMKLEGSRFDHQPPYLVFAYYAGGDLANWIERRRASGGIGWERALVAFEQMAEGLSLAHAQGIVHRDIKPGNILLDSEGRAVIGDFGLGKIGADYLLNLGHVPSGLTSQVGMGNMGTALYMPQEIRENRIARGDLAGLKKGDVYALGVTAFHLFLEEVGVEPVTVHRKLRAKKVPEAVITLIEDCISDPSERPADAGLVCQRLKEIRGGISREPEVKKGTEPASNSQIKTFTFKIVKVNKEGKIISSNDGKADYIIEQLDSKTQLEMVKIPGGKFQMGSAEGETGSYSNEKPQHQVKVPSFLMGKYPVTQAQWKVVSRFEKVKIDLKPDPSHFKGANRPVENVSWYEAEEFCARLSKRTGKKYRLPSEAEWEYACRAGTTTPFHFGETITTELVNYGQNIGKTTEVGSFPANEFGVHDMHGNVWEWCADHWHDSYRKGTFLGLGGNGAPTDGSAWLSSDKAAPRLLRGGSWYHAPQNCRSAYRYRYVSDFRSKYYGFRCSLAWTL